MRFWQGWGFRKECRRKKPLLSLRDAGASLELEQSAKLCGNLLVGVLYGN